MGLLDMIGPVMVGPSSSHTAGACRLALLARHLFGEKPRRVEFGLHGSFAKTGKGHGTHLALAAGVLGLKPHDERLKESLSLAEKEGLVIRNVDTPGVVARVARILADDEVNIAHLTVSRKKRGGEAMMSLEVDRPLSEIPLRYLEHLSYILWVRQIPPVMD